VYVQTYHALLPGDGRPAFEIEADIGQSMKTFGNGQLSTAGVCHTKCTPDAVLSYAAVKLKFIEGEGKPEERREALRSWHSKEASRQHKERLTSSDKDAFSDDEVAPKKKTGSKKAKDRSTKTKRKEREV
jgi:hypothetical protein